MNQTQNPRAGEQAQHTATPWKSRVTYSNGEPDGACVYSGARHVADCMDGLNQDECEANAAFIVRACNAHEELVTFAHNVLASLEENGAEANLGNIVEDARALLARIQEGQP